MKEETYPKEMGFNITGDLTENREAYELWYKHNSHFSNHAVTKDYEFIHWLLPFVYGTVIDLGCQWGGVTQILCDQPHVTMVDAIDITDENVRKAKDYVKSPKLGGIWKTYIEDMFCTRQYDTVVCTGVIEHVLDPVETLMKCIQLIAPNGQLLLMVPNGPSFPEPDHVREYDFRSLTKDIRTAAADVGKNVHVQTCATFNAQFDIEHYSWLLARVTLS